MAKQVPGCSLLCMEMLQGSRRTEVTGRESTGLCMPVFPGGERESFRGSDIRRKDGIFHYMVIMG